MLVYHLSLLLCLWLGIHIEIQFQIVSVYFSKFHSNYLCPTQIKGMGTLLHCCQVYVTIYINLS
jgi:hypothetical protein